MTFFPVCVCEVQCFAFFKQKQGFAGGGGGGVRVKGSWNLGLIFTYIILSYLKKPEKTQRHKSCKGATC